MCIPIPVTEAPVSLRIKISSLPIVVAIITSKPEACIFGSAAVV
jgi:riboflavin transporter FmnP